MVEFPLVTSTFRVTLRYADSLIAVMKRQLEKNPIRLHRRLKFTPELCIAEPLRRSATQSRISKTHGNIAVSTWRSFPGLAYWRFGHLCPVSLKRGEARKRANVTLILGDLGKIQDPP